MNDSTFEIGARGVDTAKIVAEIKATVAEKAEKGLYNDPRMVRAERRNVAALTSDETLLELYLENLSGAVFVDISDFEIKERRRAFTKPLVVFKKLLWNILKFYTYRMWSQQNEINGLLVSVTQAVDEKYRDKIAKLEARIAELEKKAK